MIDCKKFNTNTNENTMFYVRIRFDVLGGDRIAINRSSHDFNINDFQNWFLILFRELFRHI